MQGPVIVCTVFAYLPFVDRACGPPLPQGGNDDTYFYQYTRNVFFFSIHILCLCSSPCSYRSSSCPAVMGCSQLCFKNFTSIRYRERLILYSLYQISGPCTFSKFIACCITCRRNGTGSFSLISLDVSFLNSKVILHHVASRGLVPSSLTGPFLVLRWDI